jgi:PAS domain S-box-containing protein
MSQFPNILIVDDIEENLILLESVISGIKVHLIKALSGAEALEKTKGIELALAIIDVRMPDVNGYELAATLNEERTREKVPVIFLTAAFYNEEEVFKGYNSGAVDYMFKPLNKTILLGKINVFIDLYNQKKIVKKDAALLKNSAVQLAWANAALKEGEEKYRSYIDNAPDGVFVADENGRYLEVNLAACRITGYSKAELLSMSVIDLLPEESVETGMDQFRELLDNGTIKTDLLFKTKQGLRRWWTLEAVRHDKTRILCFAKEITDRKRTEDELKSSLDQLHQLTKHIEKVREDERVAISRELHDDLGQALTAVKIDLELIRQSVSNSETELKVKNVSALVSETIKTVQRLTSQLRPAIIDDLGIEAAIEWYTKEYAQRNGVEILLETDSRSFISPETSLIIFRILQESLTNIARHSKATLISISLMQLVENLCFIIADNGVGITEAEINSKKSFGIIGMKERSASLGGKFEIHPGKDGGTIIKCLFPLNI